MTRRGEIIGQIVRPCDICGTDTRLIVFAEEGDLRKLCPGCFKEGFRVPADFMRKVLNNLPGFLNKKGVNMENSKFSQDDSEDRFASKKEDGQVQKEEEPKAEKMQDKDKPEMPGNIQDQ